MEAIRKYSLHQDERGVPVLLALQERLERLGVAINFWRDNSDRLAEAEHLIRPLAKPSDSWPIEDQTKWLRGLIAGVVGSNDDSYTKDTRSWIEQTAAALAQSVAPGREGVVESLLDDLHMSDPAEELFRRSALLIRTADSLVESQHQDIALKVYKQAVDLAPSPQAQLEVGYLLALRGSVQPPVPWHEGVNGAPLLLMPRDGGFSEFPGLNDYEVIFDELLKSPKNRDPALLRLALEAYGRVFCHFLTEINEAAARDQQVKEHSYVPALVIDGLNTLMATEASHNLRDAALQLVDLEELGGDLGELLVEARLRTCAVFADGIEEGRLLQDQTLRQDVSSRLAAELKLTWPQLPKTCREYLVNGEVLFQHRLQSRDDHASTVNEYSKAVEFALRQGVGSYAMANREAAFSIALWQAIDQVRNHKTKDLRRVSFTNFSAALTNIFSDRVKRPLFLNWVQSLVPEADEDWLEKLFLDLQNSSFTRGRSDHAVQPSQSWKVSRQEAEQMRDRCIGPSGIIHHLARLQPRRAGE